jgi:hypothetical protein
MGAPRQSNPSRPDMISTPTTPNIKERHRRPRSVSRGAPERLPDRASSTVHTSFRSYRGLRMDFGGGSGLFSTQTE